MLAVLFRRLLQTVERLLLEMSLNYVNTSLGIPLVVFYRNSDITENKPVYYCLKIYFREDWCLLAAGSLI